MKIARPHGFTLAELMVTLAIVAILATLAAPSFKDFFIRNTTSAIANEFTGSLLRARAAAATGNVCVTLCRSNTTEAVLPALPRCVTTAGNWNTGWIIFRNPDCDSSLQTPAAADRIVAVVNATNADFSLTATNTSPQDYIYIDQQGHPRRSDSGGFDLQYRTETRSSNRRICLSTLGEISTVDFGGVCP